VPVLTSAPLFQPKIPDIVKRTICPTPMQMVDDDGISELISLAQVGADGGTANSESILSELKPFIKHNEPKPVLAGLKVGCPSSSLGLTFVTVDREPVSLATIAFIF